MVFAESPDKGVVLLDLVLFEVGVEVTLDLLEVMKGLVGADVVIRKRGLLLEPLVYKYEAQKLLGTEYLDWFFKL